MPTCSTLMEQGIDDWVNVIRDKKVLIRHNVIRTGDAIK